MESYLRALSSEQEKTRLNLSIYYLFGVVVRLHFVYFSRFSFWLELITASFFVFG